MTADMETDWLDPFTIAERLAAPRLSTAALHEILIEAREAKGLSLAQVAALTTLDNDELLLELFASARYVKENIYGRRMVLFAPLYLSSACVNDCTYCAFRASNHELQRHTLNLDQIRAETRLLIAQGHKRLLLVAGESLTGANGLPYLLDAIDAIYAVSGEVGNIRRVNVNVAPLSVEDFRALHDASIGTYQLFQESYHQPSYAVVHRSGPKADFAWRLTAMDRAMSAGIEDVGLGVLFGLHDWRFELLALLQHNQHLEQRFGVGCHTISVPRIEPAHGAPLSLQPPAPVSDRDFMKLIAILRLALPYTGLILSTRETPAMRRTACALGVSQLSAGSSTTPGGYGAANSTHGQFEVGDQRPLDEVITELASAGYIPSFCTACYRLGRTGADFMDLAKPGLIRQKCDPNAVATFQEYLIDFALPATRTLGEVAIASELELMQGRARRDAKTLLQHIRQGKRDVFC